MAAAHFLMTSHFKAPLAKKVHCEVSHVLQMTISLLCACCLMTFSRHTDNILEYGQT